LGGQFEQAKVISLRQSNGSLSAVQFSNGEMTADNFVFTLGPWSGDIARSLGLNVPFESEGGYHIELINPSEMPLETVKVAAGKFVVTPMQSRIRLAGIVDFSGLDGPDNSTAIELLKISAKELFPSIRYERMETWHGHRPTTANSLPLIGKLQTFPNAFVGFGHQHVGLTGGAKTGRILANLVTGEESCIDLSAFDPNTYNCSQI
jgi:D-amino-acid dehydrogenase